MLDPQAATVGAKLGRKLNLVIEAAARAAPDPIAFCGGLLSVIAGKIAGLIGATPAAELVRLTLAGLERNAGAPAPLALPPGMREQMSLAALEAGRPDLEASQAANYQRESGRPTLTAAELLAKLQAIVDAGRGAWPARIMLTGAGDGLTHASPIVDAFAAEPYDGELVWILPGA